MRPLITIGMPVYNSDPASFNATIADMLGQTFGDFELIVSDNGSDAERRALYESAATLDSRIRYIRHDTNRGALWNFRFLKGYAQSPRFAWISDRDKHYPDFLRCGVEAMGSEYVGAVYGASVIPGHAWNSRYIDIHRRAMAARHPWQRMLSVVARDFNLSIYGLFRTDAIRRIPLPDSRCADYHMLIGVLAAGPLAFVEGGLVEYRVTEGQREPRRPARMFFNAAFDATRHMNELEAAACVSAATAASALLHPSVVRLFL